MVAVALAPGAARAWDGDDLWNNPANGGGAAPGQTGSISPGGGGIFGTGGARDYFITCANCHVNDQNQQGQIDLAVMFTPPLTVTAGQSSYKPGQLYQVSAQLTGEHLGLSGCGPYVNGNVNNMVATVEDASGRTAGLLASDSGQSSASCPATAPMVTTGTTIMSGDCHAVAAQSGKPAANRTQWYFSWTAPAAGSGALTMYWGAVDGDCKMDSFGDDVRVNRLTMTEGPAVQAPRRPYALAALLLLPALWWATRRKRPT
jgi:hypothetical protein